MRRLIVTATLMLVPALALAGNHEAIHMAFAAPPALAVVQPGVQVVVDSDEEVFYANNAYWARRGDNWYHASHHNDAFTYVDVQTVPPALAHIPPGYYLHYHPDAAHGHGHGSSHGHDHGGGHDYGYNNGNDSGYGSHGGCGH